jgi:tRNA-(ms[2]io[6]A)-hydroxylase
MCGNTATLCFIVGEVPEIGRGYCSEGGLHYRRLFHNIHGASVLCLKTSTRPTWLAAANADLASLLIDHAHCEKKAAATALGLINRYPERSELVTRMLAHAKEELEHFEIIHRILEQRGIIFTRDEGNRYAQELHVLVRKNDPERLIDLLLVAAIIEARSCERFAILAEHCVDEELRDVYKSLLASEAGHYTLFTDLARMYGGAEVARVRLGELAAAEGAIVENLNDRPTMHG